MIAGSETADRLFELSLKQSARIADQIVVVDSSLDGTGDVARAAGAEVYYHQWLGDFAFQRNISLGYCKCDWCLQIDTDELIDDAFIDDWPKFLDGSMGYRLPTYNFVRDTGEPIMIRKAIGSVEPWYPDYHIRLFANNPYCWYRGGLHEGVIINGPVTEVPYHIYHYGWAREMSILERRMKVRNEQEKAIGRPGQHTVAEPLSDREEFDGKHPKLFDEKYLKLQEAKDA